MTTWGWIMLEPSVAPTWEAELEVAPIMVLQPAQKWAWSGRHSSRILDQWALAAPQMAPLTPCWSKTCTSSAWPWLNKLWSSLWHLLVQSLIYVHRCSIRSIFLRILYMIYLVMEETTYGSQLQSNKSWNIIYMIMEKKSFTTTTTTCFVNCDVITIIIRKHASVHFVMVNMKKKPPPFSHMWIL